MIQLNKVVKIGGAVGLALFLGACSKSETSAPQQSVAAVQQSVSPVVDLKIINWGPQEGKLGEIPNKQPDGNVGIWIEVNSTKGLKEDDVQVLFAGQPAVGVSVQENLITGSVVKALLATAGDKEVSIKQVSTQKTFPVGVFKVTN